jgi:cytochrome c oxidase subunit II
MRHFVVVGILIVVVSILAYAGLIAVGLMPVAASAQAGPIDRLLNLEWATISFLSALILVPFTYSLIVFRRKKGDTTDATHVEGNTNLEIIWTIVPLFLVMAFAYLGAGNLAEIQRADPNAMVVRVTAQQWSWSFEYPEFGVTSTELHVPVDRQILLQMTSRDVIHSFWVPEFRPKQDLVPGRITQLRVTPTKIGNYKVRCAEMCGTSHAYMEQPVIVSNQTDFDAWMAEEVKKAEAAAATPEGRGQALVSASGCAACHSINGAVGIGPTWYGLFGSQVPISGDGTVTADEAYIHESIKAPQAKIVAGFENQLMPTYGFNDDQINDIVAYIKTLK